MAAEPLRRRARPAGAGRRCGRGGLRARRRGCRSAVGADVLRGRIAADGTAGCHCSGRADAAWRLRRAGLRVGAEDVDRSPRPKSVWPRFGRILPADLQAWGGALVETLDQDGPEPDDRPRAQLNELHLTRHAAGSGGRIRGRFDDPAMCAAIASAVDAHAAPRTADDDRSAGERQAEALADICGYVLDHAEGPARGGERPHLSVVVRLEDLENRARAGCLELGGDLSPDALRMLCCDARVVPVVLGGAGQPLDVGRATRVIPDGLRRAIATTTGDAPAAGVRRPGARSTTSSRGSTAAPPAWPTAACCAARATGWSTTAAGTCTCAKASPSSSHRGGSTPAAHPAADPDTWHRS